MKLRRHPDFMPDGVVILPESDSLAPAPRRCAECDKSMPWRRRHWSHYGGLTKLPDVVPQYCYECGEGEKEKEWQRDVLPNHEPWLHLPCGHSREIVLAYTLPEYDLSTPPGWDGVFCSKGCAAKYGQRAYKLKYGEPAKP